jgi:hypothetical protein
MGPGFGDIGPPEWFWYLLFLLAAIGGIAMIYFLIKFIIWCIHHISIT